MQAAERFELRADGTPAAAVDLEHNRHNCFGVVVAIVS